MYGPCLTLMEAQRLQTIQNCYVRYILKQQRMERTSSHITALEWVDMNLPTLSTINVEFQATPEFISKHPDFIPSLYEIFRHLLLEEAFARKFDY